MKKWIRMDINGIEECRDRNRSQPQLNRINERKMIWRQHGLSVFFSCISFLAREVKKKAILCGNMVFRRCTKASWLFVVSNCEWVLHNSKTIFLRVWRFIRTKWDFHINYHRPFPFLDCVKFEPQTIRKHQQCWWGGQPSGGFVCLTAMALLGTPHSF